MSIEDNQRYFPKQTSRSDYRKVGCVVEKIQTETYPPFNPFLQIDGLSPPLLFRGQIPPVFA